MTKSEAREIRRIMGYVDLVKEDVFRDYVARALSALHRASRSSKTKAEIAALAAAHGVTTSLDWII